MSEDIYYYDNTTLKIFKVYRLFIEDSFNHLQYIVDKDSQGKIIDRATTHRSIANTSEDKERLVKQCQ